VLAIDRQQQSATLVHSVHENLTGTHQCLFIGQKKPLTRLRSRECRGEPCESDDCCHHGIHLGAFRKLNHRRFARVHLGLNDTCQARFKLKRGIMIEHDRVDRTVAKAQLFHFIYRPVGR
jgi:hypothetical protein